MSDNHDLPSQFQTLSQAADAMGEPLLAAQDYLSLPELIAHSDFTPLEQQLILYILNQQTRCDYCMDIHSEEMKYDLLSDEMKLKIDRHQTLTNERENVLKNFLVELIANNDQANAKVIEEFLSQGFTQKNVVELSTALSMKAISNYSKHLTEISSYEMF
jgi:alkylhydroperoxidase family enzyme